MSVKIVILFLSIISLLLSCNTTEPPVNGTGITLKLEDVSCTEAWLKLTVSNSQLQITVLLLKDDSIIDDIILDKADTLLYIDSLLPNTNYTFYVNGLKSPPIDLKSNKVSLTTLDTTSHNFTFEKYTFGGQAGSCTLYDVAIIDENNIWAVREIYLLDSLGQPDPNAYNTVHWNGNQWELIRIKTNACGGVTYPPIKTIFAFSSNDLLFAHINGSISHYNGTEFTNDCSLIRQLNGSAIKIWGISRIDFYVVSGSGLIAHYQNGVWNKIESGTDLSINDVWGSYNPDTGEDEILCVASNQFVDQEVRL